jgi:hypothetical protein
VESALIAPAPARRPYGVGINSQELLRFFATDFHMTEWTGAWFVPDVRFPDSGGRPVVSGKVSSNTLEEQHGVVLRRKVTPADAERDRNPCSARQ